MKTVDINSITTNTSTNADGDKLYEFLINNAVSNSVSISFHHNSLMTSSFLNSSIGKFIDVFGIDKLKSNVRIQSNKRTFSTLKKYINDYQVIY